MSRPARRFAAVIFDLDGVLVDAEIWWDEVRIEFARRHGRAWTEADRAAIMGANSFGWSTLMRDRLDLPDVPREVIEAEVVEAMVARYGAEGAPLIDGAVEAVRRVAAALPVAVASSGHPAVIAAALDALGIADVFGAVASSDEVPVGKPDPGVYLLAAARLGLPPADCLVVEDSLNGVLAGRAAGMTVVLVPNGAVPPAAGAREAASVVLDRIAALDLEALEAIRPEPESGPERPSAAQRRGRVAPPVPATRRRRRATLAASAGFAGSSATGSPWRSPRSWSGRSSGSGWRVATGSRPGRPSCASTTRAGSTRSS